MDTADAVNTELSMSVRLHSDAWPRHYRWVITSVARLAAFCGSGLLLASRRPMTHSQVFRSSGWRT